jgi:hypothetical protein
MISMPVTHWPDPPPRRFTPRAGLPPLRPPVHGPRTSTTPAPLLRLRDLVAPLRSWSRWNHHPPAHAMGWNPDILPHHEEGQSPVLEPNSRLNLLRRPDQISESRFTSSLRLGFQGRARLLLYQRPKDGQLHASRGQAERTCSTPGESHQRQMKR